MTVAERLRRLVESLPSERSSVTFTKADLLEMLEGVEGAPDLGRSDEEPLMDLSVSDIMEATGRARSTVIGWINRSDGIEAYKFLGREWRVSRAAWQDFLRRRRGEAGAPRPVEAPDVDLGSWRSIGAGDRR